MFKTGTYSVAQILFKVTNYSKHYSFVSIVYIFLSNFKQNSVIFKLQHNSPILLLNINLLHKKENNYSEYKSGIYLS